MIWALPLLVACGDGEESAAPPELGEPARDVAIVLSGERSLGSALHGRADLDLDGALDLLAGAPSEGSDYPYGAVYLFCGPVTASADTGAACAQILGSDTFTFGSSVVAIPDADAEAAPWVAAAEAYDYPDQDVYLFSGPIVGAITTDDADVHISDPDRESAAYATLSWTGDADQDGYAELVVAEAYFSSEGGRIFSVDGPWAGELELGSVDDYVQASASDLGFAVAGVGDADGDGVEDLLAGGEFDFSVTPWGGGAWLLPGPITGAQLDQDVASLVVRDGHGGRQVGWSVSGAGDMDGDGLNDLLVGALDEDELMGGAYLFSGRATGTRPLEAATACLLGSDAADFYDGISVAGAEDVDQDGVRDVLVGGASEGEAGELAGAVWLAYGPLEGSQELDRAATKLVGDGEGHGLGRTVAGGGDLSGDGRPDPVAASTTEGEIFLLSGLP